MLQMGFGNLPVLWTASQNEHIMAYTDANNPSTSYTSGAVIANLPQLGLSALYLTYNNFVTRFFTARELRSFAIRRRGLRVSTPAAGTAQRAAHFLQIPLRYSLLNIATFVLLHTLLSQTLFLHRTYALFPVSFVDPTDIGKRLVSMIGFSPLASFVFALLMAVLVAAGLTLGFWTVDWALPDTSGRSFAVAAACHPPKGSIDTQDGEVRWGVVSKDAEGVVRCSFSLLPVRLPDVGERVEGYAKFEDRGLHHRAPPPPPSRPVVENGGSS